MDRSSNQRARRRRGSYKPVRLELWRMGARCCYFCADPLTLELERPNTLTIDHLTPLSRGGLDIMANMASTCSRCNGDKGDMTEAEYNAVILAGDQFKARPDMCQVLSGQPMKEPEKRRAFWEAVASARAEREARENKDRG